MSEACIRIRNRLIRILEAHEDKTMLDIEKVAQLQKKT